MFRLAELQPPRPPESEAASAAAGDAMEQHASVASEANAALVALLPWVISVLLHLGLGVIAFFAIWSVGQEEEAEQIIVPLVELSQTPGAPLEMRTQERVRDRADRRRIVQEEPTESSDALSMSAEVEAGDELVGVTGALGDAESPFGTAVASGAEFRTSFMGVRGGNARRIAFVIDASGSLIDTFPFVIAELVKSINRLSERQQFTVIFFQGSDVLEVPVPRRGLRPATGENKQRVIEWVDMARHNVVPGGREQNPVPAIELALRYRPDVVFLLSDDITGTGPYAVDQRRLLNAIERANTAGTNISTIQFLYPDPLDRLGLRGTMELIADQSGGTYQFVDEQALGLVARSAR